MKFNYIDVPYQWKDEFTKYPHGYTIFEALCKWVKQVDNMVDNINNWNTYLDNFVESFEFELQEEVQSTIERWQSEGLLDGIIESALNTELDNVKAQLAQTTDDLLGRGINVMSPPAPLIPPVGDGIADDTQALNNIIDILEPGDSLYFPFNKEFLTTETLHFKSGVSYIMDSPITYDGEGIGVVIGTNSVRTYSVELKLKVKKKEQSNWENDNDIGIRINNVYSSNIEIANVANFTIGVQFYADGNGVAYNNVTFGNIQNNRIGVHLSNINGGWVNENNFYGGRFWCQSSINTNKSRFGVVIESLDGGYTNNNNNNFLKPSFELRKPTSGEALPILIVHGSQKALSKIVEMKTTLLLC